MAVNVTGIIHITSITYYFDEFSVISSGPALFCKNKNNLTTGSNTSKIDVMRRASSCVNDHYLRPYLRVFAENLVDD